MLFPFLKLRCLIISYFSFYLTQNIGLLWVLLQPFGSEWVKNYRQLQPQLISLSTKDVATDEIQKDLITAEERGKALICKYIKENLVDKSVSIYQSLTRNKSNTFSDLYKTPVTNKQNEKKVLKADKKLIQKLFNASVAGRKVQMGDILVHELSKVPLSLGKLNGTMNSPSKAEILGILSKNVHIPHVLESRTTTPNTCVMIDGQALVQAIQKPKKCHTFDDYGAEFTRRALEYVPPNVQRLDIVFDTYQKMSIKALTRVKRAGKQRPIRKIIESGNVPLPKVWSNFISLNENKTDLAGFLSHYLMEHAHRLPNGCELVTGGGFEDQ